MKKILNSFLLLSLPFRLLFYLVENKEIVFVSAFCDLARLDGGKNSAALFLDMSALGVFAFAKMLFKLSEGVGKLGRIKEIESGVIKH